ncbi:LamG-like jellyroll fold domain-containing protein [Lutibacter sp.]|uniref:LamG-like jellyroll fold domain-containing protein n=1 Tax=Lutibacter sp. TaxID=1925666 RepID=UPI0025C47EE4|nr:LamG-like jellyroll fold domain-containing protein [Lutibacter sp.]MCF6180862.1 T9SS type A sorting domain-containing protein [Lutibacter sp.]
MLKKILFILMLFPYALLSQTIYVDQNATGNNNGTDWLNAYTDLQIAITNIGTNTTINVAQGTYYPTATTDRAFYFSIPSGVKVYGGFPTGGGTRDLDLYSTILSGDIGTIGVNTDNSYHVVYFLNTISSTEMDGFIIEKGYANGSGSNESNGGGILILTADSGDSNAYIRNCTIRDNYAVGEGGGIYVYKRAEIYNCKIYSNQVTSSGGGISISTSGRIYNSYIVNNKSVDFGGGLKITGINTAPKAINCVIANNECENYGAGAYLSEGSLNNCTIVNNGGNGVHFGSYGSTYNGIIWGNSTYQSTHVASSNSHLVENNCIQDISTMGTNIGISSTNNGAIYGENYPRFTKPTSFKGNATTSAELDEILNANWSINPQSAAIDFGDNSSYPTTTDTPTVDIIGSNRTINTTMDAGAHEALTNIITNQAANQQPTSATLNGEVLFAETGNTITRGFVYATTPNFDVTTATSTTNSGTGLGIYTDNITGLTENQMYYYKTWVQFDGVKYYGNEVSFKASNLIAYYPFNGNANDESGNVNNGIVNGATLTTDKSGNADSAYSFNGISDFIQVPNSNSLDIYNSDLSISMWLYNDNPLTDNTWKGISKGGWGTNAGYELIFTNEPANANGILALTIGSSGNNFHSFNDYNNQWVMLTGTYDNSNGTKKIFINGIEQTTVIQDSDFLKSSPNDIYIGRRDPSNIIYSGFVKGKMDDIRIYNAALTASEVLALYTAETLAVATEKLNTNLGFYVNNNTLYFKNTQNLNNIKNIIVFNMLGQKVYQTDIITNKILFNSLKTGVYILKVENKNGKYNTLKFIIF